MSISLSRPKVEIEACWGRRGGAGIVVGAAVGDAGQSRFFRGGAEGVKKLLSNFGRINMQSRKDLTPFLFFSDPFSAQR